MKVIYLGDIMQLPPVSEKVSEIFASVPDNYPFYIQLDEIMRTSSSDIKDVCSAIRNWNGKDRIIDHLIPIHQRKGQFRLYHRNRNIEKATWFRIFSTKMNDNELPIILTWTNKASDFYNRKIRQIIHQTDEIEDYLEGDIIMFNNFYQTRSGHKFYTSDVVKIEEVKVYQKTLFDWKKIFIPTPANRLQIAINHVIRKIAKIKINFEVGKYRISTRTEKNIPEEDKNGIYVYTITRHTLAKYQEALTKIRSFIEIFFKDHYSKKYSKLLWDTYYSKMVDPYAEINFGYSITVHKAQGSTFNNAFVDFSDISNNVNTEEAHHCVYTASGRASKFLGFII